MWRAGRLGDRRPSPRSTAADGHDAGMAVDRLAAGPRSMPRHDRRYRFLQVALAVIRLGPVLILVASSSP